MDLTWRAKTTLLSALKGWATVVFALQACSLVRSLFPRHGYYVPFRLTPDALSYLAFFWFMTFVAAMLSTAVFVLPYFCWRSGRTLGRHLWRLVVEPALIVSVISLWLAHFLRTQVDSFLLTYAFYGGIALLVSVASSLYFVWSVRRWIGRAP